MKVTKVIVCFVLTLHLVSCLAYNPNPDNIKFVHVDDTVEDIYEMLGKEYSSYVFSENGKVLYYFFKDPDNQGNAKYLYLWIKDNSVVIKVCNGEIQVSESYEFQPIETYTNIEYNDMNTLELIGCFGFDYKFNAPFNSLFEITYQLSSGSTITFCCEGSWSFYECTVTSVTLNQNKDNEMIYWQQ